MTLREYLNMLYITEDFELTDSEQSRLYYLLNAYPKEIIAHDNTLAEYYNYLISSAKAGGVIGARLFNNLKILSNHPKELSTYKKVLQLIIVLNTKTKVYLGTRIGEVYTALHSPIKRRMYDIMLPYFKQYNPSTGKVTIPHSTSRFPSGIYYIYDAELETNLTLRLTLNIRNEIQELILKPDMSINET